MNAHEFFTDYLSDTEYVAAAIGMALHRVRLEPEEGVPTGEAIRWELKRSDFEEACIEVLQYDEFFTDEVTEDIVNSIYTSIDWDGFLEEIAPDYGT